MYSISTKCISRVVIAAIFAVGAFLPSTPDAHASILIYTIGANSEVSSSGGFMPGDAVVTFDDNDTAGTVTLTMDLTDWVGGDGADTAYAFEWFFSLVGFSADDLDFNFDSGQEAVGGISNPAANFDGHGNFFPFSIVFEQSNNANRFTAGETSVYTIDDMGLELLTVNNFYDASNDPENWQAGLRARGLNDGRDSGWFVGGAGGEIPEPTSFVVWGMLGFTGVAMSSRRRRKR